MRGKLWLGAALAAFAFAAPSAYAQAGGDQPADATTTAQAAPGQDILGDISAGDADWFRLRVEQGQRYHITLDAAPNEDEPALDTVLSVYNLAGDQLAYNDDSNQTFNSELYYAPAESGEVFLEARAFSSEAEGRYRLHVEASPLPPDDAANDASTRASIEPDQTIEGELEIQGDTDWYRLNARSGQMYRISLSGSGDAPLGDPLLRVVGADGEELAVNDDYENLNSYLEFAPARSGHVFVVAGGFADAHAGAYTLGVEASRLPPDEASNDTRTRGRLRMGRTVEGSLDYSGDRDWYRMRLEGGETYRFALSSDSESESPLRDPLVRIYDGDGGELAMDDDGGGELNSLLEFTAPETGNYFIEAAGYADQIIGAYTLRASEGDIPANASTDMSLSAAGDYREGALAPAGDRDWYRIDLTAGEALRISLANAETPDGLADPYIVLYGPDSQEVARDDDSGEGLNAWLEYEAAVDGPHYLEARGFGDEAQGRYYIAIQPGEIGDSYDTAEAITPGGEGRVSVIGADGDADWFSLELVEGRSYRFNLQGVDSAPLADPYLVLYNANGEQVAADDDGGRGLNSYLSFASPTGGPHFVSASSYNGEGTGRYLLSVIDTEVPGHIYTDEYLDANGDDRLSRIEMPGDLDTYRVDFEAGARYLIEVRASGDYAMTDPYLVILNEAGERVTSDDDSGPGLDARLRFTPESAGIYYIQASGLGGSTGGYRVSVARE